MSLHPYQYAYFNSLANWGAKENVGERFDLDYWGLSYRQGIEHLLEKYPQSPLYIYTEEGDSVLYAIIRNSWIMTDDVRKWLFFVEDGGDFYIANDWMLNYHPDLVLEENGKPPGPVIHSIRAYDSDILTITAPGLADRTPAALAEVYRAKYREVIADELTVDAVFDLYLRDSETLRYAKTDCATEDTAARFYLHIFPKDADALPAARREHGFDNRNFAFNQQGGRVDDKCWATAPLPDYPIALIRTGQVAPDGAALWQAEINPDAQARFAEMESSIAGLTTSAAGSFQLYQDGKRLLYHRNPCVAADTQARFFLHLFPTDEDDLPEERQEYGFDNPDFYFSQHGAHQAGKCLAEVPLPGYEIGRIRTGQYAAGEGEIWAVDLPGGR